MNSTVAIRGIPIDHLDAQTVEILFFRFLAALAELLRWLLNRRRQEAERIKKAKQEAIIEQQRVDEARRDAFVAGVIVSGMFVLVFILLYHALRDSAHRVPHRLAA